MMDLLKQLLETDLFHAFDHNKIVLVCVNEDYIEGDKLRIIKNLWS